MVKRRNQCGFTLLEIIVVLLLISLIVGMAGLQFSNRLPSARLQATARQMAALFKHAKVSARLNQETRDVVLDLDAGQFYLDADQPKAIPRGIGAKVVNAANRESRQGKHHFIFQPGGATACDDIVLWNEKKSVLIQVDPIVGSVVLK